VNVNLHSVVYHDQYALNITSIVVIGDTTTTAAPMRSRLYSPWLLKIKLSNVILVVQVEQIRRQSLPSSRSCVY
jgi:hypothetical protein